MSCTYSLFIILIVSVICTADPLITLWGQTCKVHADTNHAELKEILKQQDTFSITNWLHSSLVAILSILGIISLVGCCFLSFRYIPLLTMANQLRHRNQQHNQHPPHTQPFNVQNFSGRPVFLQELPQTR